MIKKKILANTHDVVESDNSKYRKKLIKLDVSGLTYNEKKELLKNEIEKSCPSIFDDISFKKISTRKSVHNPDGIRILIHCNWIKRNRFFDLDGKFRLGTVYKAYNKYKTGTTNESILAHH